MSTESSEEPRGPGEEKQKTNGPQVPATQQFCESRNILGCYRLAATGILIPVSGCGCCTHFAVVLCSQKWRKDEQLPTKADHMSSLTYRPWAANLPYGRHPFLVLYPLSSDGNLDRESVGTGGSNLYSSLLATVRGKEKVLPIPPPKNNHRNKRSLSIACK